MRTHIDRFRKEFLDLAGFAESTVDTYSSSVRAFDEYARQTLTIEPLTCRGKHLQNWLQTLRPGISRSRLRQHQQALKCFCAFLVRRDIIDHNPAAPLPNLRKRASDKNQPVPPAEVFKILAAVDRGDWFGRRNHLIIVMLWCLGLRISELTGLTVESFEQDYDPDNRIGLLRVKGKNKKQRALFVVDALYDDLLAYLKEPESPKEKKSPLFPVRQGKAISSSRIQKVLKEYLIKAGVTTLITPHAFRHTFATEMYCQAVPCSAIQAMMGHDDKAETAIYIHIPNQLKKEALARIAITKGGTSCP